MDQKDNKFILFLKKIFIINDTPHKISLGLGLGVFLGILPGTGPLAALLIATTLRINPAAAFLGCILVNTWLTLITFLLSIKIGSAIMHLQWQLVYQEWLLFIKDFHWSGLFKLSSKIILPAVIGSVILGLILGLTTYLITLVILTIKRRVK